MRRLSPILIVIFLVTSVLIYLFGDSGVLAFNDLEGYRRRLVQNVESLQQRNKNLTAELSDLKGNAELNIVLARRLGLYRPGDEVLRLQGLSNGVEHYVVGDLLKFRKSGDARSAAVKTAALCLSALMTAYVLLSSRASRRKASGSQGG
jgi:cell division protein FtsB